MITNPVSVSNDWKAGRKGSITVYLCLFLVVILSLICAALFSTRTAAARTLLSSTAEQSMYSVFAGYDRTLFETYGILALDGGSGTEELRLGTLLDKAEEVADYITGSGDAISASGNITGLEMEDSEVTGYELLTDNDGTAFREQVCTVEKENLAEMVAEDLKSRYVSRSKTLQELEQKSTEIDSSQIEDAYREAQKNKEETTTALYHPSVKIRLCEENQSDQTTELSDETAENPIDTVLAARNLGIYSLVIPAGKSVSAAELDSDTVPAGKRVLQKGMGVLATKTDTLTDMVLMRKYLTTMFSDFTSEEGEGTALRYQIEYAIAGEESDEKNLKEVLNQLLLIREVSNYLYLSEDTQKMTELKSMAATISAMFLLPAAEPVVEEMLKLCWSFGESVLDIRELLKGGKIPLLKDKESWQMSLQNLIKLQEESDEQHSSAGGLTYKEYLELLLYKKSEKDLTMAMMELVEFQICEKNPNFRVDNCIVSAEMKFSASVDGGIHLTAQRSYGYDTQE